MRAVIYLGSLKIAKTKYGQFARGKRADLEDVVALEVLKIPGFEEPTFPARYLGKAPSRSLQVQGKRAGTEIIVCPRGIWKALPVAIKYKIVKDPDFEIGPAGSSAKFLIAKQQRDTERRNRIERIKHRPVSAPAAVETPKPEVKFEVPITIDSLGLPARVASNLKAVDIRTVADLPKGRKLLEVKGIGASSAKMIREKVKEV